jgi:tetratricopeptide (TPR) repeat protein
MIPDPRTRRGGAAPALHLPFVDALTTVTEGSPAWAAIKAGWLVLRFVDKWAEAASHSGTAPWLREVHAIHETISSVAAGPTRRVLERLYAALLESWGRRDLTVSSTLLAYGHHLERDEAWGMAADVFETFLLHAATDSDHELAPDAYLRLAYTHRRAGRVDDAAAAYDAAGALALSEGNVRAGLLARIGSARVIKHRGNLPAAGAALDAIITDAAALVAIAPSAALSDALARAKHDRGTVANEMGYPADAVALYYDALQLYEDEASRERVLGDIATNLAEMGLRDAARDANAVLYNTAQDSSTRSVAGVNLMMLAQEEGQELIFEQHRRALGREQLSPEIEAYYHLYAGEGLYRFGSFEQAVAECERALDIAERVQLNAVAYRADVALAAIARRESAPPARPGMEYVPAAITHVVSAVRQLRETAGVAS